MWQSAEQFWPFVGRTPKGACPSRGRSGQLLETPFSEPLLRTLLRTLVYCKTHRKTTSQNPSENPSPEPFPEPSPEPFLERCVAVRPLRRAPYFAVALSFLSGTFGPKKKNLATPPPPPHGHPPGAFPLTASSSDNPSPSLCFQLN